MMEPLDRVFVTLPGSVAIVEILGLFVGGDEPFEALRVRSSPR